MPSAGMACILVGCAGNEVGIALVPRARSVVGPGTLRAPRNVSKGRKTPEHD